MFFLKKKKKGRKISNGFSIPEMIVAIFLFSMVMVVSVGAVLSVTAANRKTFALSTINNSLVYAIDSMIKDIRTGTDYDCGQSDATKNCPLLKGAGTPQNSIHFKNDLGDATGYRLNGDTIEKLVSGSYLEITPAEIRVTKLDFYVDGVGGGSDNKQPAVIIAVVADIYYKGKVVAKFDVETMAVQRKIEINE